MPKVRKATPEDHPTFARLFPELGVDDAIPDATRFATEMVPTTILAEDEANDVLGYAYWVVLAETVHLSQIVVAKDARGKGVGRLLMTAVRDAARATGRTLLSLNVNPSNTPALRLYESFGMKPVYGSKALRLAWEVVDELSDEETSLAGAVRPIEPHEDARVESESAIVSGYLGDARSRAGRVLRVLEENGVIVAAAVFDTTFPGAYPFKALHERAALSMLHALRPHARETDAIVNIVVMDQPHIADMLIARGATIRLETVHLRGPL